MSVGEEDFWGNSFTTSYQEFILSPWHTVAVGLDYRAEAVLAIIPSRFPHRVYVCASCVCNIPSLPGTLRRFRLVSYIPRPNVRITKGPYFNSCTIVLKVKISILSVLWATRMFLPIDPLRWQSKEIYVYMLTHVRVCMAAFNYGTLHIITWIILACFFASL